MEENEFSLEFKFISSLALSKFMNLLCVETLSSLSVFSSHPLFSCIVTLCTLILLYLPHLFWKLVLSPVLILTGILLLAILRFGANQRSQDEQSGITSIPEPCSNHENRAIKEETEQEDNQTSIGTEESNSLDKVHQWIASTTTHSESEFKSQIGFGSNTSFGECFVESWNVKAPLEVIYEEYEGEEAEADPSEKEDTRQHMDDPKYPSLLSRDYTESESDSGSSSEGGFPAAMGKWDSPENICFRWDEEDREGLIEIALDGRKKRGLEFHFEEENLIEIDISPTRHNEFPGENELFSGEIIGN